MGCITLNTRFRPFKPSIIHSPDQNAELLSSISMRICAALQSARALVAPADNSCTKTTAPGGAGEVLSVLVVLGMSLPRENESTRLWLSW